jgi:hypothetical protein
MRQQNAHYLTVLLASLLLASVPARAETVEDFYRDKTITM